MELIQEREQKSSYEVAYDCGEHIVKVVRINTKRFFGKDRSSLEIQKSGLDLHIESLEFEDGQAHATHKEGSDWNTLVPTLNAKDEHTKEILKEYAGEFAEIFKTNRTLREHLPTIFKDLQAYLPNYSAKAE